MAHVVVAIGQRAARREDPAVAGVAEALLEIAALLMRLASAQSVPYIYFQF